LASNTIQICLGKIHDHNSNNLRRIFMVKLAERTL